MHVFDERKLPPGLKPLSRLKLLLRRKFRKPSRSEFHGLLPKNTKNPSLKRRGFFFLVGYCCRTGQQRSVDYHADAVVTLKAGMLSTGISFSRIIGESRKQKSEREILIGQKAELRCLSIECKDSLRRRSRAIQTAPDCVWSCNSGLSAHRTGNSHLSYIRKITR